MPSVFFVIVVLSRGLCWDGSEGVGADVCPCYFCLALKITYAINVMVPETFYLRHLGSPN